MRRTRTILQAAAPATAAVFAVAAPAGALAPLPTGNLVANGDEGSLWSATGYAVSLWTAGRRIRRPRRDEGVA